MSYGYGPPSLRCPACGGIATNPHDTQCRFCGAMLYAAPPPAAPPQQGYYPPPQQFGAPPGYGGPPGPYGAYPPVQSFGGSYGQYVNRGAFGSGMSTIFWIRIAVVGVVIALSMFGACMSAIANN